MTIKITALYVHQPSSKNPGWSNMHSCRLNWSLRKNIYRQLWLVGSISGESTQSTAARWHHGISKLQPEILEEIRRVQTGPFTGVTRVYSDRKELEPFATMVEPVKQELFIVGIELNHIVFQELSLLEGKARDGVRIRLLMTDPGTDESPNPSLGQLSETLAIPQLEKLILSNIERVQSWLSKIPSRERNRIELRVSSIIPTHIITFVDCERPSGFMHVELLPPGCDPGDIK